MCGFLVNINGNYSDDFFIKARDTLIHRGPDGSGFYNDNIVQMGHRLLSITGDNAVQPMIRDNNVICFNGEIYNFLSIKTDLRKQGIAFDTDSDTEVLIKFLKDFSLDKLNYLNGDFSFVLYDKNKRKIYAVRDAFGVKPLVWAKKGKEFSFASEAKAILELGYERRWNKVALQQIMSIQYTWNETLFSGIKEVPAGHLMVLDIDTGKYTIEKWFNKKIDYDNRQNSLREILNQAVKKRLYSKHKYSLHLSGGIDSAIICALASQYKKINTYTIGFEGDWSELEKAEKIAKGCNVNHNIISVNHSDMLSVLPEALYHGEGIAINGHIGAKYILNKKIHQDGCKINLSGEGSDELFLGYPFFREEYFTSNNLEEKLEQLRNNNQYLNGHMMGSKNNNLTGWLKAKTEFGKEMQKVTDIPGLDVLDYPYSDFNNPLEKSVYSWRSVCLSNYILKTLADGQEMAHSIEGRPPFLDQNVVSYADGLSYKERLDGDFDKQILRDSFADMLPEDIVYQRKHPFISPPLDNSYLDYINSISFINNFPGHINKEMIKNSTVKMAILSLGLIGEQFKLGDVI